VAIGCTGGLDVRIILTAFTGLEAIVAALAGRVDLPTGKRADLDTFVAVARAPFALFFAVRVLADRPAVFAECLLIILNIAANFGRGKSFFAKKLSVFN
jgi:hypothetical protein